MAVVFPNIPSRVASYPVLSNSTDFAIQYAKSGLASLPALDLDLIYANSLPNYQVSSTDNLATVHPSIWRHLKVLESGRPNFLAARIRVPSSLNIANLRADCSSKLDHFTVDMLEFGCPLNFEGKLLPAVFSKNYPSAKRHPDVICDYVCTELNLNASKGPFLQPLYPLGNISPLGCVPKPHSDKLRVIVDQSFHHDGLDLSVNANVPKKTFLGVEFKLHLPAFDLLIQRILKIHHAGGNAVMFGSDFCRWFRQIPIDPLNYPQKQWAVEAKTLKYVSCCSNHDWSSLDDDSIVYFTDEVWAFGDRGGPFHCHSTSCFVARKMHEASYYSQFYQDDHAGVEDGVMEAGKARYYFSKLCERYGFQMKESKDVPPTQVREFLGAIINSNTLTIQMKPQTISDAHYLILSILDRATIQITEVKQLCGHLNWLSLGIPCVRLFMGNFIDKLRVPTSVPGSTHVPIEEDDQIDLRALSAIILKYNGASMMLDAPTEPDLIIAWDACPYGFGRVSQHSWYGIPMPDSFDGLPIHVQELGNVVADLTHQVEEDGLHDVRYLLLMDNQAAVFSLNGRAKCPYLRMCVRQLFWICAQANIWVEAVHYPGEQNRLADAASRVFHPDPSKSAAAQRIVTAEINQSREDLSKVMSSSKHFNLSNWKNFSLLSPTP